MRLRYLSIDRYPPLSNVQICFSNKAPWPVLGDEANRCGIHFIAGLNGSGKSHLLRAISAIFLAMADGQLPGFPFTLIYELGANEQFCEVVFDNPGKQSEAAIWQRTKNPFPKYCAEAVFSESLDVLRTGGHESLGFVTRVPRGSFPQGVKDLLPKVLAYTSGSWRPWQAIWQPPLSADALPDVNDHELYGQGLERPAGWTHYDESSVRLNELPSPPTSPLAYTNRDASDLLSRPFLLSDNRPDAALLAVALHDSLVTRSGQGEPRLAALLQTAGWHQLVSVGLLIDLDKVKDAPPAFQKKIHDLLLMAGDVIAIPHPNRSLRRVYFDIEGDVPATRTSCFDARFHNQDIQHQGDVLALMLGEASQSPFSRFHELIRWMALGLVGDLEMCIRRDGKTSREDALHDQGIMAYSEMSDGEQMVLRRWALFYLLAGEPDALLLLDEPETHFNDSWKREIVSIIEHAMGRDNSAVLVASHSSIVLSDVFDEEVIFIAKDSTGHSRAGTLKTRTFGTEPGALLMSVFKAKDSIGSRAKARIEKFLDEVKGIQVPLAEDIAGVETLIAHLGTGFHRSELRVLLNRWKEDDEARALKQLLPSLKDGAMRNGVLELLKQHYEGKSDA
ncbi:AAA family ATPase [Pseudomonas sp. SH10-3B]|uniref:AAA family ATPase n=1 Tax=Pseudomonas sp. SH10-3B TaxID=2816049 RepID=UPI001CA6D889|nr:AAA family ATPase [Pseudomonas sp. SH10-3B]MBY8945889.1 AAA family ATPase [Pseudomonas sp. SH10-3B]